LEQAGELAGLFCCPPCETFPFFNHLLWHGNCGRQRSPERPAKTLVPNEMPLKSMRPRHLLFCFPRGVAQSGACRHSARREFLREGSSAALRLSPVRVVLARLSHFGLCEGPGATAKGTPMIQPNRSSKRAAHDARGAFSLVELIAVIAIIVIMTGLLVPAVKSFTSTAGRKGAVNILMNTFEQARTAALESGANVYVVLWKRQFPDKDCLIVMREATEWDPQMKGKPVPDDDKITLIPISRYLPMPEGVLLFDGKGKNVFKAASLDGDLLSQLPKTKDEAPKSSEIGYVQFSPNGTIQHPSDSKDCKLFISEGVRGAGGTEALIGSRKEKHGGFEVISFRRFTGRASVDVSVE
jgi:type II secretory pathway pseudopilin PulG